MFYDASELRQDDFFPPVLANHIEKCKVVIFFVSSRSIHSKWVENELFLARQKMKPVICVYLEKVALPSNIVMIIGRTIEVSLDQYHNTDSPSGMLRVLSKIGVCITHAPLSDLDIQNECVDGCVLIQPGKFLMGSPEYEAERFQREKMHMVPITKPYFFQLTPVTQEDWRRIFKKNPSSFKGKNLPVDSVSWYSAIAYCNAMSRKEGLEEAYIIESEKGRPGQQDTHDFYYSLLGKSRILKSGYRCRVSWKGFDCEGYRLPTEAEWEYAARAGVNVARYGDMEDISWNYYNSNLKTHPVGEKTPNKWGLFDTLGNVWEWVWDWYGDYDKIPDTNPIGPEQGNLKLSRGGCWMGGRDRIRFAVRGRSPPENTTNEVGFRMARSAIKEAKFVH